MQNQTLISWNFFVFYYVVVFLKQTPNQLEFFWYLFSFLRYWDSKICIFSTSGTRAQSNFGFYVLLFINFFDQDVHLYVFGGKEFKNAVRFAEI